jgi:hypothetical protein
MTVGPILDGLPFQPVMLLGSLPLGVITYNFSLKLIFFHLVPMSKVTKYNHLQINNLKIIINLLTSYTKKTTAKCSRNYDTHIIYHTYDILYSMTTLLRVEGRSKLQSRLRTILSIHCLAFAAL